MATLLVNYADQGFGEAQKLNTTTGLIIGRLDRAVSYGRKDLDAEFCARNRELLAEKVGAGNWLWKPYIVVKALREEMAEGDVLFYSDCGAHFMGRAAPAIDLCLKRTEKPILLFTLDPKFVNRHLVKRDCFYYTGMDSAPYPEMTMIWGSFILCQKTPFTTAFFEEWLNYASDPRIIGHGPNQCGLPNYPGFFEHRYEQAILSLLGRKHGIQTLPDISQWETTIVHLRFRRLSPILAGALKSARVVARASGTFVWLDKGASSGASLWRFLTVEGSGQATVNESVGTQACARMEKGWGAPPWLIVHGCGHDPAIRR